MPEILIEDVLAGDPLAVSRVLTQVEDGTLQGRTLLHQLFPHTGNAHLIGITGAPGTGKSTLVNRLALHYRHPPGGEPARKVAVLAVDPSSPFSGGAVLGDRIRMQDLAGDPGVFIRSTASRGSLGGLSAAAAGMAEVFDAAGFQVVIIETVGAGQAEVDIARLAHTTVVLDAPGLGDDIQTIKAGILEIADILVVNKADRPGAENAVRALKNMLELPEVNPQERRHHQNSPFPDLPADPDQAPGDSWQIPVLTTTATTGEGIARLAESIQDHHAYLVESDLWSFREQIRLKSELDALLESELVTRWKAEVGEDRYQEVIEQLFTRQISPRQAVQELIPGEPR